MNDRKIETIEDLDLSGPYTAERLREAGYSDLRAVANAEAATLAQVIGIHESTASMMIKQARKHVHLLSEELPRRVAELEETIERLNHRLDCFEELHRMQALPIFSLLYIVDYDGPMAIDLSRFAGEPTCILCGKRVYDCDAGYELETRRFEELLKGEIKSRTALMHFDCYAKAAMGQQTDK
ncbi:helix-hairpin-helix domain-containing protein [Methanomassiliicoccus luminyensis]|uniref:helix-hairpin-helix domain-containing protein n=1 Tax=Methanomassiliicoccus luminyensis TaxID=1080712 RepID=UPI00037CAA40|nr:helix-hairpin-helix domain-containing protein [Methanomassiliicoccus luminyensis]